MNFRNALKLKATVGLLLVGCFTLAFVRAADLPTWPATPAKDQAAPKNAKTSPNPAARALAGFPQPGTAVVADSANDALDRQDKIPYGNNAQAGNYLDVGDAKLYYEVYGNGQPLLLLHGGVYGYIDEFAPLIDKLSQTHRVICLATRGHGKSQIGSTPFTWAQRAKDAYEVIRSLTRDSVLVIGFSDGAFAGYKLAATYPQVVKKMIAIGAGDAPKGGRKEPADYSPQLLLSQAKAFFESRKALMPEPNRWGESLSMLNKLYNDDYLSRETFENIRCPVLVMSGDQDHYHSVEGVTRAARFIPESRLSIIPGCPHVVLFCNFPAVWEAMRPFIAIK